MTDSAAATPPADRPPGVPFAAGREADVYALDDHRVLRRYRSGADASGEAEVMAYVGRLGYPVPEVFDVHGADLVMARLTGPTMSTALTGHRLGIDEGAAMLAELLRRLHELPPWAGASPGTTVVHLDLHPENVILTGDGPVVIDWRNARAAPADLDTALTALIMAQIVVGSIPHELVTEAGAFLDAFLARAPGDPIRLLDDALAMRFGNPTMSRDELALLSVAGARVRDGRR